MSLAAFVFVTGISVLLAIIPSGPARGIVPLNASPEDQAAFPELALLMQPTAEELTDAVRESLKTDPESKLIEVLEDIGSGKSHLSLEHQTIWITLAAGDRRVELLLATLTAVRPFGWDLAKGVIASAVSNKENRVALAGLEEIVRRNDSEGAQLLVEMLYQGTPFRPACFATLRRLDSKLVEPLLFKEKLLEDPETVSYLQELGTIQSLGPLVGLRDGRKSIKLPTDHLEAAIEAIWKRELTRHAGGGIRFEESLLRIGDAKTLAISTFQGLPVIPEVRDELTAALKSWPDKWDRPGFLSGSAQSEYYTMLELWSGQKRDELILADLKSEKVVLRKAALNEFRIGKITTGIKDLFDVARTTDNREINSVIDELKGEQLIEVVDLLRSPDSATRERSLGLLKKRSSVSCLEPLFRMSIADEAAAPIAYVALTARVGRQVDFPFSTLNAAQNVQLAIATSTTVADQPLLHRMNLPGQLSPSLREMLIQTMLFKQFSTLSDVGQRVNEERAMAWLLAVDEDRMLPILLTEFSTADTTRQHAVMTALACSGSPKSLRFLANGLLDDSRRPACAVCLEAAGIAAEAPTLEVLNGENVTDAVRAAGCQILRSIATKASLPTLQKMAEGDSRVKELATQIADRVQRAPDRVVLVLDDPGRKIGSELRTIRKRSPAGSEAAVSPDYARLLEMLESDDPPSRARAACELVHADVQEEYRRRIVKTLESTFDPRTPTLSWFGLQAYGRWGSASVVGKLASFLRDENPYIVTAAACGLSEIAGEKSRDALIGLLRTEQFGFTGRMALIRAGEKGSPEEIATAVVPALNDPDVQTRIHAAVVMARLGTSDGMTHLRAMAAAQESMLPLMADIEQTHRRCQDERKQAAERMRQKLLKSPNGKSPP